VEQLEKGAIWGGIWGAKANSYNAHFFSPFFFFIADSSFFLFAFFLGPYSKRNFF
jgi:hypothetical protein